MAYAYTIYSAGSSQTDYTISFPYIKEAHVKVYVNYVDTSFTFHNATTARLASAPASGTRVEVRRVTPPAAVLVDYADGSTLTASDLDTSNLQHLYIAQELDDTLKQGISISSSTGLPTLGSQKLTNVADPTAAQDAATKNYVDTTTQPVDAELTELATMSSGTASSLADLTNTEVQILDGATVTTDELNKLDGVTATTAEINYVDGVTSNVQTQLNAKQPLDAELTELATMASDTASSLADLTAAEVQALDGVTASTAELNLLDGVTATTDELNIVDGVTATAGEINILDGVTATTAELNIMDGVTATTAELNTLDGVASTLTATELNFVDGVTSALQAQLDGKQPLDADLTSLSSCQSGAATNIALLTSGEVAILDGATVSTAELNTLSGLLSSTAELNKLDGVTSTTANLNVVSGMTKATSLTSNSDTELPTSKAVADHVTSVVNALGGFVAVNGPTNFPATQPDQDVVVSIKDVGSGFTTSSNEITITNGAGSGKNVKITDFPSEYAAATLADDTGLQVTSNKSASDFSSSPQVHRYKYHKQLAKESDVKQLSDDINAFNERYRTATGSNPSSNNHAGDLFFSQDTDKMYVRNAANSAWDEVVSVGEFFINTLSSLGNTTDNPPGGSASFNGQARKFTLSNPPSVAQQLIVSINGVIQKPNSGIGFPSEGFSLNGSALQLAAAPATGAPFFIITIGSTVNIGTPSAGTVDLAKLSTSNTGSTGQYLKKDGSTQGIGWADVTMVGGANTVQFNDNVKATFGTGNDLEIYHTGSIGVINNGANSTAGHLVIRGDDIYLQGSNTNEELAHFVENGACELYYDNSKKFETTSTGVNIPANNLTIDANNGEKISLKGTANPYIRFYESSDPKAYIQWNSAGYLDFQNEETSKTFRLGGSGVEVLDDVKFTAGSSQDFQLYHDGTHSYIKNTHTSGYTHLQVNNGDAGIKIIPSGAVELYHNDVKKFETIADGVKVSGQYQINRNAFIGTVATGQTTINIGSSGGAQIGFFQESTNNDSIRFYTHKSGVSHAERARITEDGHLIPGANNTYDLGSASAGWRNIYTNDLNLSNEGSNNDVDGSWGSFTIQEGEDDLFLINRRNGKKYKFNLTEVS